MFRAGHTSAPLILLSGLLVHSAAQAGWNPRPNWKDSYSVGDQCYCDSSNFDHNLDSKTAPTPIGELNVTRICADLEAVLGEGPAEGRIMYNDIQCGHGPANDAADEAGCPGRVDLGADGCQIIGPTWNLERVYGDWPVDGGPNGVAVDVENDGSGTGETQSGTGTDAANAGFAALDRSAWALSASHERGRHSDVYKAIDGDDGSRWSTGTRQAPGQHLTIDLGQTLSFDRMTLATERSPDDYPREYRVEVSVDGVQNRVLATGSGGDSRLVIDFDTVEAQYITIFQEGTARRNWWSVHEIDVFRRGGDEVVTDAGTVDEPSPPETDVPGTDAPGTDDDVGEVTRLPELLFERYNWQIESSRNTSLYNVLDEYWGSRWTTRQSQRPGQFFQGGHGRVTAPRCGGAGNRQARRQGARLRGLPLGGRRELGRAGGRGRAGRGHDRQRLGHRSLQAAHTARFVRIEQTGSHRFYWWSINELHVGRYAP